MEMLSLNFSCQGQNHIASGKVCQDYSYSHVYEDSSAIAIVCDGHGGSRYFRSDVGAKLAAEVAESKVRTFADGIKPLISGQKFTRRASVTTQIENDEFEKMTALERAFRQLFGSIIFEWNTRVAEHATCNPLTEQEIASLDEKWITDFRDGHNLEKVYGCTLICCATNSDGWFAFQIGDGKCFMLDSNGNWSEPIPWDDRCFLNKTTSICDSDAIDEFRYCFCGDGTFPAAMILGSDGIDDSFGAEENQENFYVQVLKTLVTKGYEATFEEVAETLPQLSKVGSQDDMSVAMVFNLAEVERLYSTMVNWQIANVKTKIEESTAIIERATKLKDGISQKRHPSDKDLIDLHYAELDAARAAADLEKLQSRLHHLSKELDQSQQ